MLWIYAYRYGLELSGRCRTFKAASFSFELSDDRQSGMVILFPGSRALAVGGGMEDYHCVRVFDHEGLVKGTMSRSPAGEVRWQPGCEDA